MRVLHVIPSMGGGGAERQLAYLAGELPRLGWETHVALAAEGANLERLLATGARVHRLRARGNHDPRLGLELARVLARVRPALVQTWILQMDILGGLAALRAGVPWLMTERNSEPAYARTLKTLLRERLARRASAIVCNSGGGVAYWERRIGPRHTIGFLPNALPLAEIEAAEPLPRERLARGERPVILFVGRFSPEKNLPTFTAALRAMLPGSGALAVVCGEGPERAQVESELQELMANGSVIMPGYVPDVWRWMKRATVMVSTSSFEGCPNAIVEAAACGCPLVLSDIPAHRELLDETEALFVETNDVQGYAAALQATLSDPAAAAARARCAAASAGDRSTLAVARQWVGWYERIVRPASVSVTGRS